MLSPPEECGQKEARDVENNITISDSTLHHNLPPQIKNVTSPYKLMCSRECLISANNMYS